MTLEQWAYIGEIIAAVAVIASLVYLGIQVRQSNVLSRAQTRQSMIQMAQQEILAIAQDPTIWTAFTKEEITDEEKIKLHEWLIASMRQREYEWFARNDGVIDSAMFGAYSGVIPLLLGTERTRRWWAVHRQEHVFDAAFVSFVDGLLDSSPRSDYFYSLDKW